MINCHSDEIELSITNFIEDPRIDENEQEKILKKSTYLQMIYFQLF